MPHQYHLTAAPTRNPGYEFGDCYSATPTPPRHRTAGEAGKIIEAMSPPLSGELEGSPFIDLGFLGERLPGCESRTRFDCINLQDASVKVSLNPDTTVCLSDIVEEPASVESSPDLKPSPNPTR